MLRSPTNDATLKGYRWSAAHWLALGLILHGCSSGSGGSSVGKHPGVEPTARAQILNGGSSNTFREGSEILLTGKASEDGDGPVIAWSWQQTAGPPVRLLEVNSTTVSFTAPAVTEPEALVFELTVEDTTADTGRDAVNLTVVPARDADRFLFVDVRPGLQLDTFKVVAALAGGATTGSAARPFRLSARAHLVYPPRSAPDADCSFDPTDFAGGIPASTASGCLVELLEDLTPSAPPGGDSGTEEWPAGIDAPDESARARAARWWNPRFTLKISRLDARAFNQPLVDADRRDRLLDGFAVHAARVVLELGLTAPHNQQDATLILTDFSGTPVSLPAQIFPGQAPPVSHAVENGGNGLPTSVVLPQETLLASILGAESALTAAVYYRTVDPNGTRTTLNAWLQQAGFTSDGNGTLLPEAVAGTGEFAHTVYVNNFDLGFGRDMYARVDEFGNVFSFVKNHTTLEGAIRKLDPFATVVMEYSPLSRHDASEPKFVKFFTYIRDGSGDERRVASFDFDGRGERFTPGNCVSCHGGARPPGVSELLFDPTCGNPTDATCYAWPDQNRLGQTIADGDLNGMFLPWDLDSLLYADTDPAITSAPVPFNGVSLAAELERDYGDYSRAAQAGQFKKLNQAAYVTYGNSPRTATARALVEQWYGGVDQNGNLIASAYDDTTPVPGWRNDELVPDPRPGSGGALVMNPSNAEDLYHEVHARHCRMCHANLLDASLRFDTYQAFISQQDAIRRLVFRTGMMPGARLTMDRFWSPFGPEPAAGPWLAEHLALVSGEDQPQAPGAAVAQITGMEPAPRRGDTVYLGGARSAFADTYSWSLSAPAGSAATLVGAQTAHPTFVVDLPGVYEVALVAGDGGNEDVTAVTQEVVNRAPIAANDLYGIALADAQTLEASVLTGDHQDSDPDGDPLSVASIPGAGPSHGTLDLDQDGTFTYTYTGDIFAPPASDNFSYLLSDAFGGTAEGLVTLLLTAAPAGERPTPPAQLTAVDASIAAGSASSFAVELSWLASTDDDQVVGYRIYRDGELLEAVASAAPPGSLVTHIDTDVTPDTGYTYRVTSLDAAANESALSDVAHVTVVTSLRQNIQTGWGDDSEALWGPAGCIGCHAGPAGGLTLRGSADEVYSELTEDADGPRPLRIDTASPVDSLLLCKPLLETHPDDCAHAGGDFFIFSDPPFQTLLRWIEQGAPNN